LPPTNHHSHPTSVDGQQDSRSRVASPDESTPHDHATNMTVIPTAGQSPVISHTIVAADTSALSDTQTAAVGLDHRKSPIPSTATAVPTPSTQAAGVPIFRLCRGSGIEVERQCEPNLDPSADLR